MTSTTPARRPRPDHEYRWYDYFEKAWFAAALVAGVLIGLDRIPAPLLMILIAGGLLITFTRAAAALADIFGGDRS